MILRLTRNSPLNRIGTPGLLILLMAIPAVSGAQLEPEGPPPPNPFAPPQATMHYERDRDYDLKNLYLRIKIDWDKKTISGTATETLAPLRDGLKELIFDAAEPLKIAACRVNGAPVKFKHEKERLTLDAPAPLPRAKDVVASITYSLEPAKSRASMNGGYGFRWIRQDKF